jgi:hypothetical protein
MANTLITTSYLANKTLEILENNLVFAKSCNRQYADDFGQKDFKIGATVNVRRPPRYIGTFGPNLNIEDTNQTYIPVSINYQFHVDAQFSTADMELQAVEGENSVIPPALEAVYNRIDSDGLYFAYQNTALAFGTPGVSPTGFKLFSDGRATLMYEGAPRSKNIDTILDPLSMSSMADALKGTFNPQAQISDFFRSGIVARKTAGSDWYEDQNVPTWTTGAGGGAPVLAGITTAAAGSFLQTSGWAQTGLMTTTGWTASVNPRAVVGDIIQVNGLFPVNPQNRGQYGRALKQFVVIPPAGYAPMTGAAAPGGPQFAPATLATGTFNATTGVYSSSSGGALTLTVAECAITGGQFQNCVASAAFTGTPAITVNGGTAANTVSPQGIMMLKDAFALAFVDLPLPRGVETAKRAKSESVGMSVRIVEQYTVNNDALPTRFDVAYGYSSMYRQQALRISG